MTRCAAFLSAMVVAAAMAACGETDGGITASVETKLKANASVSATDIDVTTRDGVVTLRGEVESPAARELALRLARESAGVRDVVDELRIEGAAATTGVRDDDDDADIDIDVDADVERGVRETGDALRKGAEETGDAARDAGRRAREAVTDSDRDSDKDGK